MVRKLDRSIPLYKNNIALFNEFTGYVNLSYRLENNFKYFKDIMIFEEHITEKSEMSLDERLYIIEDKLRRLEKKVGIK